MKVERSRRVKADDGRSGLEVQFERLLRAADLPEPVREYRFDWCCQHLKRDHTRTLGGCRYCAQDGDYHMYEPGRNWRLDFAWPDRFLAVEVEGGTYAGGRHTRGKGYEEDCEKYSEAALQGWCVLRFTGAMLDDGRALELLERAFRRAS